MLSDLDTLKMVRGHVKQEIETLEYFQDSPRTSGSMTSLTELEEWLTEQIDQTTILLAKFGGITL